MADEFADIKADEFADITPKLDDSSSMGVKIARHVGQAAQGINDSFLPTMVGGPIDLAASGMRAVGIPVNDPVGGSESIKRGIDYVATLPGRVRDAVGNQSLAPFSEQRTSRFDAASPSEKIANAIGHGVGGTAALVAPAGAVASAARPGSVTQQIATALASQPVAQATAGAVGSGVTEATGNPWLGAGAAIATPFAVGAGARAISPMGPAATASEAERRRLVDFARGANIPLTTGQITGNKGVQTLESVLEALPLSGGLQRGLINRQREAFNREVTGSTGAPLDAFTRAAREQRRGELGQEFNRLSAGTTVNLDPQFTTQLNDALTRYRQQLPQDVSRNIEARLQTLIDASTQPGNPQIPGEIYQGIRSTLGRQANSIGRGETADALREMQRALDAAARRSLPPDVGARWDTVRDQWGNLRTIEAGMRNADAAVGDISPRALGASVDSSNRRGSAQNLTNISDVGRKIIGDQIANSGTPQRSFWQNLVTGAGPSAAVYGSTNSPLAAAGTFAAPALTQMLLENPATRAYAGNRLAGSVPTIPDASLVAKIGLVQALQEHNSRRRAGASQ